jgi:hypothetical protein
LGKRVQITSRSWGQLLEDIKTLQRFFGHERVPTENGDNYFISEPSRYIFFLVELQGKIRQKHLEVTPLHYKDKSVAKKWMTNLMRQIHPDVCNHPQAKAAAQELYNMYKEMIGE